MRPTDTVALLLAAVALGMPGPGLANHASDGFESLRSEIETIRSATGVPGAAVVIVDRHGILWNAGVGVADVVSGKPVTADTVFRIGSVTKVFTAAALLQLGRRGDFSLDEPVSKYIPEALFYNPWKNQQPITVAHLLEHTSGFRDWTKAEFDHNVPLTLEQGLAFSPQSRTAHWKPGLHAVYSNANYGLAGLVLERVSQKRYETVLRDALFTPLEMHTATSLQQHTANLATGYQRDGITVIPYWHMIQRPAAGINATARDIGAMVSMLLNNGRYNDRQVLSAAEVARMETPQTSLAARNGLRFGYGLGMYAQYRNRFRFMGHGGDGDGYLSRFGYCRQLGVGYFVTINSHHPRAMGRLRRAIENALTEAHQPPPAPPIALLGDELRRRYSGRYVRAAWRFDWQDAAATAAATLEVIAAADGSLWTEYGNGKRLRLLPVTERTFRRLRHGEATSGFFEADGALFFQEEDNWVKAAD